MFNSQSKPELNRYILDFFRKCNLSGTAESFEKESDVEVEEVVDTLLIKAQNQVLAPVIA